MSDTLNKTDLIKKLADDTGRPQQVVKEIVDSFVETVNTSAKDGVTISVPDLGKFEVHQRNARDGINPATGEKMHFPAKFVPKFKPSTRLKESAAS